MPPLIPQDISSIVQAIRNEARLLEGKTLLISGGAGFLGSYLVQTIQALNREVFSAPCRIVVLDNFITGSRSAAALAENDPNITFVEHDVRNPVPEDIRAEFVIHAAGLASPAYYRKFPLETVGVAVEGTRNFLEYCRQNDIRSFLYFSSSEVYGDPDPAFIPTPEHYYGRVSPLGPRACYDESKRLGETLCMIYRELYQIPVKIVRPFNVYGPGMKPNDYRVIPTFVVRALRGEALPVHEQGNQTRTFCYASDAVAGFFKVLLSGQSGEVYNVGRDDEEIAISELAHRIAAIAPNRLEVSFIRYPDSYPGGEPRRRCPDIAKIRQELGFEPQVRLQEGLRRTFAWFESALPEEEGRTALA